MFRSITMFRNFLNEMFGMLCNKCKPTKKQTIYIYIWHQNELDMQFKKVSVTNKNGFKNQQNSGNFSLNIEYPQEQN